jgi:hypothetical protein
MLLCVAQRFQISAETTHIYATRYTNRFKRRRITSNHTTVYYTAPANPSNSQLATLQHLSSSPSVWQVLHHLRRLRRRQPLSRNGNCCWKREYSIQRRLTVKKTRCTESSCMCGYETQETLHLRYCVYSIYIYASNCFLLDFAYNNNVRLFIC